MSYDVVVVGGGPAGSTAAALLARGGARVVVLERERFPRFHVGESLLPRSLPILDALGVELDARVGTYKAGAEFIDEDTDDAATYWFADALPGGANPDHAFQVDRATFDTALLEAAGRAGATVHQGEAVRAIEPDADAVTVLSDRDRYRARYCIDATGQDALLARQAKAVSPLRGYGRGAAFTHYADLGPDALRALGDHGNIKVLMGGDGWAWLIPLPDGRLSLGVVHRERALDHDAVDRRIAESPLCRRVVDGARRLETRRAGNFSFRNARAYGSRVQSIGDAACFLDPVFSSGVAFAMTGAEATSARLLDALADGTEADPELMAPVADATSHAYAAMAALVHAFYHTHLLRALFFAPKPDPILRAGLISMLAGDLGRDDNVFEQKLFSSRRPDIARTIAAFRRNE